MGRKWKLVVVFGVFFLVVLYIEVFDGILAKRNWPEFKDSKGNAPRTPNLETDETLRILLVADPQIIGEKNEPAFLGLVTRWDSDRYLHSNYKLARDHLQPHIVAFLGDLFDEGVEAYDSQYRRYIRRFTDIYELPKRSDPSNVEYIFLPGDNDVGGEHEQVNPIKVKWFNLTFGDFEEPFWLNRGGWNVQFLKLWSMTFPSEAAHQNFLRKSGNISKSDGDGIRIVLSHLPYWKYSSTAFKKMIADLKPSMIFSGNDHHSGLIRFDPDSSQYLRTVGFQLMPNKTGGVYQPYYRTVLRRTTEKMTLSEITVPTCSYRMGVPDMGFGAMRLCKPKYFYEIRSTKVDFLRIMFIFMIPPPVKNGTMDYTVLWVPSRFFQLKIYLGIYICWKLIFTPWILWKIYCLVISKLRSWRVEKADKHVV